MPLPTVKPAVSRSPLPAELHEEEAPPPDHGRARVPSLGVLHETDLAGLQDGDHGRGDAGGRGDDLGALKLGLVLLDALLDVRHDVVGTRPGDETRGARGGSDARGGGDAEEEPARLRREETAGGTSKSARRVRSLARTAPRGVATAAGRYPPHFCVGEGARRRGRGRRAVGGEYAPAASGHRGGADRRGGDGHGGHCACVRPRRLRVRVCGARRHPAGALGEVEERPAVDGMTCRAEKIFTI